MTFWEWLASPRYTKLEQEQAKRIDYLEIELHRERENYRELMERIAFPKEPSYPIAPSGPFQSVPETNKVQAEARRLSQLSKARLQEQIAEMERRAASISSRDEKLSREANETAPEGSKQEAEA